MLLHGTIIYLLKEVKEPKIMLIEGFKILVLIFPKMIDRVAFLQESNCFNHHWALATTYKKRSIGKRNLNRAVAQN